MEARTFSLIFIFAISCVLPMRDSFAANSRTRNFVVTAPDQQLANEIAVAAEKFRRDLAIEWLGHEIEDWRTPCILTANLDSRAFGETSFSFATPPDMRGEPFDFVMKINGTRERLLDSVLPHEVTHTIFASHFGQPLPRWADEGACTTVEHLSERRKNHQMLIEFLTTNRGIPFNKMFAMKNYPRDILPLYAQGYSLCRFLVQRGGKRKLIGFIGDGLQSSNWNTAVSTHYKISNLSDLQGEWLEWIKQGCPKPDTAKTQLVSTPVSSNVVKPDNGTMSRVSNNANRNAVDSNSDMVAVQPLPSQVARANMRSGRPMQQGLSRVSRDASQSQAQLVEPTVNQGAAMQYANASPIQSKENSMASNVGGSLNTGKSNFYLREIERAKSRTLYR